MFNAAFGCQTSINQYVCMYINKMLSYRRETALQGML